jgi:predicted dinucleotide-binding enzyme
MHVMRITVLGTGTVGQTLAAAWDERGHHVTVGTRDVSASRARVEPGGAGAAAFGTWCEQHPGVAVEPFGSCAVDADIVVNATNGRSTLAALDAVGAGHLADRLLVDVSNPLDFSAGFPPSLSVCNTDSLGEQVQARFPTALVVKTLNTVTAALMVDPQLVAQGRHSIFMSGNDHAAKQRTAELLASFGWNDIIDLGDITTARGTEMYLALWVRLFAATGTPMLNAHIVREARG